MLRIRKDYSVHSILWRKRVLFNVLLVVLTGWSVVGHTESTLKPGRVVGLNIFGLAYNQSGTPLMQGIEPLIYDRVDDVVPLQVEDKTFQLAAFDGPIASLYMTRMQAAGNTAVNTQPVDVSGVGGLAGIGALTTSPWQSVLMAENYPVDAADAQPFIDLFSPYLVDTTDPLNPYDYGWVSELVVLDSSGNAKVVKHYAAGRLMASQLLVMPDQRSLYAYDGEHGGMLYLFVAEEAGSFTKGTLHALSLSDSKQEWRELGEGSSLTMKLRVRRTDFSKLYERVVVGEQDQCPADYTVIVSHAGRECLRAKPSGQRIAGLLEPIRQFLLSAGSPVGKGFQSLSYMPDQQQLRLQGAAGLPDLVFRLVNNPSMNTDFAVEESL